MTRNEEVGQPIKPGKNSPVREVTLRGRSMPRASVCGDLLSPFFWTKDPISPVQIKLYNVALEITVMITSFGLSFLFVFGRWMFQDHNVIRCVIGIAGLSTPC